MPPEERLKTLGLSPVWRLRTVAGPSEIAPDSHVPAALEMEDGSFPTPPMKEQPKPGSSAGFNTAAMDWSELRRAVISCTRCPLHETRTQGVFGVGDLDADWLIVGEAPGAEEDRLGEPFVGQAGKLLDAMLASIGLKRGQNLYIANILKSRPPGNRDPKIEEITACIPYLERQIDLIRPKIILAMGRIAAQSLLQTETSIARLRGEVHEYRGVPLVVTYHPAYLLRNPADKAKVWDDLCKARALIAAGKLLT
jgi:DNA polymerase